MSGCPEASQVARRIRDLALDAAAEVLEVPGRRLGWWLAGTSGVFLALVLAWIGLLAFNPPEGSALSRLSFVNASLIAPSLLVLLGLTRAVPGGGRTRVLDQVGMALAAVYTGLVSVGYASQYALLPRLAAAGSPISAGWRFGDHASIPYFLVLLGYAAFGFAAVPLSVRLFRAQGLWRWAGGLLVASGVASGAGFASYAAGLSAMEALTTVGGVLTVPFAVVVGIGSWRLAAPPAVD